MKIVPQFPAEPKPLKKDSGCAFAIVIIVFLVLLAAAGAWLLLWSGGHRDADKEVHEAVPAERS